MTLAQVERLRKRLENKKMSLKLSTDAINWIANSGYDPTYGARPLKRAIQRELETPIAKAILASLYHEGDSINIELDSGKLILT